MFWEVLNFWIIGQSINKGPLDFWIFGFWPKTKNGNHIIRFRFLVVCELLSLVWFLDYWFLVFVIWFWVLGFWLQTFGFGLWPKTKNQKL